MAQETAAQEENDEILDLADAFKWDQDDDGMFTPPEPKKTKTEQQQEVINKVKKPETIVEDDPESEHKFFEDEETEANEDTKGEGNEDKKTKKTVKVKSDSDSEDSDEAEDEDSDEPNDDQFFKTLATEMKEKGIFTSFEIQEDEEIDEDKFFELQEKEIQSRVDETFTGIFEELNNDPDAVAFLQHKRNGGDTFSFFESYKEATTLPDNLDMAQEANQVKVLKHYYLNVEEIEEEDLADKLEFLKEKGKTEEYAKKYYKNIVDKDTKAKLALVEKQESQAEENKQKAETLRVELQKVLDAGEGVGNFKFTSEEKKTLLPLITKPSVKIGPGKFVTPFQAKLAEVMKDKKKMLTLAKIIMPDFNLPDLKKAVTTEVTRSVKSKLQENKLNKTPRGSSVGERSLADLITS